jgi:DnaJ-class molecular chaperone
MKPSSDGGKGSVRRNEDTSKVLEGMTRIFGESKLDRKLRLEREEKEAMKDLYEDAAAEGEDHEEQSDEELCDWCNGTGEGQWDGTSCPKCHGTGMMPREDVDDDYI